jgi:ABC-type nickel/cobalt efflux system permease component RcnA
MQRVFELQHTLNRRMTGLGRDIAGGRRPGALLLLALVCLVYGVVHALGPGHGKTVSFSCCLTERRSVLRGMLFGVFVAFAQVLVAIILIFVLQYLLRAVFYSSFESFRRVMRLVSAGLLAAIGAWLFLGSFGLVPSFHREPGSKPGGSSSGAMLHAALAVGMVPCPGAVIIMLFAMQMGIVHLGVLLALVFALGMSVTLSTPGVTRTTPRALPWCWTTCVSRNGGPVLHATANSGRFFLEHHEVDSSLIHIPEERSLHPVRQLLGQELDQADLAHMLKITDIAINDPVLAVALPAAPSSFLSFEEGHGESIENEQLRPGVPAGNGPGGSGRRLFFPSGGRPRRKRSFRPGPP